jgi:hypothetical protein
LPERARIALCRAATGSKASGSEAKLLAKRVLVGKLAPVRASGGRGSVCADNMTSGRGHVMSVTPLSRMHWVNSRRASLDWRSAFRRP